MSEKSNTRGGTCTDRLVQVKRRKIIPRPKVHGVFFSSQTAIFCTRLLTALTKTWPNVLFLLLQDFSSVKIIWQILTSLDQIFSAKKREENPRRSGLGMDICSTCSKSTWSPLKTRGHMYFCAGNT